MLVSLIFFMSKVNIESAVSSLKVSLEIQELKGEKTDCEEIIIRCRHKIQDIDKQIERLKESLPEVYAPDEN